MEQSVVTKVVLENGLQVMLKEVHTAPIISHWIWYRVGSRDEVPGITGISHWVEHMQFKGTEKYPSGVMDKMISREGGIWNAFTYLDWTTFFETMPADKIDIALTLEADRMQNSLFDEEEVASERTVIISERQGSENEPLFRLGEVMQATAFRVHAYHHKIIGDMVDLKTMQRDDLYHHYRKYYRPSNAVLSVAGDFQTQEMLDKIRQFYGDIDAGEKPERRIRTEPPQEGEHRLVVEGPGKTTFFEVVYRTPPASHEDFFPFIVLDSLLTGPMSLNMFGGGISNKTSRLYRKLVEEGIAVSVNGSLPATIDPFLYTISVTVHPEKDVNDVIQVIDEEIQSIQDTPPPKDTVERAVKQARALFAYGSDSISNQAFWMGFTEMFDEYRWYETYLERLASVTPHDVQRIAQTYLRPQKRILGTYLPQNSQEVKA